MLRTRFELSCVTIYSTFTSESNEHRASRDDRALLLVAWLSRSKKKIKIKKKDNKVRKQIGIIGWLFWLINTRQRFVRDHKSLWKRTNRMNRCFVSWSINPIVSPSKIRLGRTLYRRKIIESGWLPFLEKMKKKKKKKTKKIVGM